MAEVAVSAALVVVQIALPILENLHSKKKAREIDIRKMHSWLNTKKAFLEENYGREGSKMQQDEIENVRAFAYRIEDVIDEFFLHSPLYTFHSNTFTRQIHNIAHQIDNRFPLYGISKKIDEITQDIRDAPISSSRGSIIDPQPSSSSSLVHVSTPVLLRENEMVGYEKPKEAFMQQLVGGGMRLLTLAVNGPGGSGKTTFANNVFSKQEIQGRFDCHAWVHVSTCSDIEQLLINLLKQLCASGRDPYPADDGSPTSQKLRRYLASKRYIVALDDIWTQGDWDDIKNALPDANRGSRIIVTTSSSNLASTCASSSQHVYYLTGLEGPEAWTLFCRKAFNGECPCDLKDSSLKIVKRCEGLPLAIMAVSGALRRHKLKLPTEWENFHDNLGGEIRNGSTLSSINTALLPSYMDLSTNLKCCFLSFSIFPEDYSVKRGRLVRLWVAERFAQETGHKTAQQVADEYLSDLIERNLVHVSDWGFDGRPRNCRVSNIILKFIIQKCEDVNFASIFARENRSQSNQIRRLSVHDDSTHFPKDTDVCGVRSMFLLRLANKEVSAFEEDLSKSKFLKVLDLQGAHLREFPRDMSRLTLVKYLSFNNTKIKVIPSSIKNLSYLETLDLKKTDVTKLPKEISYLHKLCHLFVYKNTHSAQGDKFKSVEGAKVHQGIDSLTNLQDLTLVKLGKKSGNGILKDMKKLTKLRKLGLMGIKWEHGEDLCAAVESMKKLTTLDLCAATEDGVLEVGEMRNPPETLQRLYLKGQLKELPSWISSLNNLLRVRLVWSKMKTSPLQGLERLPHLMELQLVDCCVEREITFNASGFRKLKSIVIEDLTQLHTIVIEARAMPELKQMSIRRCREMKFCPLGLQYLTKLEELSLYGMAEELVGRLGMKGEDYEWVKHVPFVHIFSHSQ